MKFIDTFFAIVTTLLTVQAVALPSRSHGKPEKPAYFVLAGDSTTAGSSANGGGWGDGFLNTTLRKPASGKNFGHNGATTVSFRAGGDWAAVLEDVKSHTQSNKVFVTIQFGHNDQKEKANITLSEYAANLAQFVKEVRAAKAEPILVTPLTRRQFTGTPPRVRENLANETDATLAVAKSSKSRFIDLNEASTEYVNEIGPEASYVYNLAPDDYTHLNDWGKVVFGRMVSDLIVEKYKDIAAWTKPNATLSEQIENGIPA